MADLCHVERDIGSVTTIRRAREDEVSLLAEIGLAAWAGAVAGVADLSADGGTMHENARFAFLDFVRSLWRRILVAEVDGHVAGWAACERPDGTITDFWIRPDLQRRGIGTRLMDRLEAEIRAAGFESAEAATHVDNAAAIAFFSRRDYRVAWLSTHYVARLDRNVEQIGLKKALSVPDTGEDGVYGARGVADR